MFQPSGLKFLCVSDLLSATLAVTRVSQVCVFSVMLVWSACAEEDVAGDDDNSADEEAEKGTAEEDNQGEEEVVTSPVAILSIDCSSDNSLIMSGCADSTVKVFNVSSGKVCFCVVQLLPLFTVQL